MVRGLRPQTQKTRILELVPYGTAEKVQLTTGRTKTGLRAKFALTLHILGEWAYLQLI